MSKVLAGMLNKPEEVVAETMAKLEHMAGYPSADAKLIAENHQAVRGKIAELDLDPNDTTGEELYHALLSRFDVDSRRLEGALGLDGQSSIDKKLSRAIELATHVTRDAHVWALKPTATKGLLQALPPKKTMKLLGYRSLDSFLKREDLAKMLTVAALVESPTWQKVISVKLAHAGSASYELRSVRIVSIDREIDAREFVISNHYAGLVAAQTPKIDARASALGLVLFILDGIDSLGLKGSHKKLYDANPTLRFWHGAEHLLAWNDGQPVSLNFKDVAISHLEDRSFGNRSIEHAGEHLWSQILDKYKEHLEELPEELAIASRDAGKVLMPEELAVEYQEA